MRRVTDVWFIYLPRTAREEEDGYARQGLWSDGGAVHGREPGVDGARDESQANIRPRDQSQQTNLGARE